ncbi:MAG: carbohydrate-binding family 9-like protein [Myxococcota bacterium]
MRVGLIVLGCIAAWTFGCTSERSLSPAQREAEAVYVSKERPDPEYRVDAVLANSIRLLGYDVDRESWERGTALRVTWYWETLAAPPSGTSLETFVTSNETSTATLLEYPDGVRPIYGPSLWQPGHYVIDPQTLKLPSSWRGGEAKLHVSLFRDGVALAGSGADVDLDGRAAGPVVSVPLPMIRPDAPLPRVDVVRTPRSPRIDANLADPVWEEAAVAGPFVDARTGGPASVRAYAKVLWDARYLYAAIAVNDPLQGALGSAASELGSIALLVAPAGRLGALYELRVYEDGTVEGAHIDRQNAPERTAWESRARIAVAHRGSDDDREPLPGYTVEIALPWQAFRSGTKAMPKPEPGDRWRANFVTTALRGDRVKVGAWSPVGSAGIDDPDRLGFVVLRSASERSIGRAEPIALTPDRVRGETTRGEARDAGVRDALIKRRVTTRRRPGEPAPVPQELDAAVLESDQSPH